MGGKYLTIWIERTLHLPLRVHGLKAPTVYHTIYGTYSTTVLPPIIDNTSTFVHVAAHAHTYPESLSGIVVRRVSEFQMCWLLPRQCFPYFSSLLVSGIHKIQ